MKRPFPFPAKPVIQNGKLLDLPNGWLHKDIPSYYQYAGRDVNRTFIAKYGDFWVEADKLKLDAEQKQIRQYFAPF